MVEHALAYAAMGWEVTPLHSIRDGRCTCGKPDCGISSGKHPRLREWRKLATIEPNAIEMSWATLDRNIGLPLPSHRIVFDVDPRNGGMNSLHELLSAYGNMPVTPTAQSGSSGWHFYFDLPHGVLPSDGGAAFGPGIDIKRFGGQAVAPPSLHLSGRRYRWYFHPAVTPVALAPDWLIARCRQSGAVRAKRPISFRKRLVNGRVPNGQRRVALFWLAGQLLSTRLFREPDLVLAMVWGFAREFCEQTPPITQATVEDIVRHSYSQESKKRGGAS